MYDVRFRMYEFCRYDLRITIYELRITMYDFGFTNYNVRLECRALAWVYTLSKIFIFLERIKLILKLSLF